MQSRANPRYAEVRSSMDKILLCARPVIDEKMSEKMGGRVGEESCEGERETAQVSSSVGVVVNIQWS
jgi:hypothetical protein